MVYIPINTLCIPNIIYDNKRSLCTLTVGGHLHCTYDTSHTLHRIFNNKSPHLHTYELLCLLTVGGHFAFMTITLMIDPHNWKSLCTANTSHTLHSLTVVLSILLNNSHYFDSWGSLRIRIPQSPFDSHLWHTYEQSPFPMTVGSHFAFCLLDK